MLANTASTKSISGKPARELHFPFEQLSRILDFICEELPTWRDMLGNATNCAETDLTFQLAIYLSNAARQSGTFDFIQFHTEVPEKIGGNRKIDMAALPAATTVFVEGREYGQFEMLLPIECKRLPTPKGPKREDREYVNTNKGTTGGIQRFKLGAHGRKHTLAGMIAYVQADTFDIWKDRISTWIRDLATSDKFWNAAECPQPTKLDNGNGVAMYRSTHARTQGLNDIELRHLWVKMN